MRVEGFTGVQSEGLTRGFGDGPRAVVFMRGVGLLVVLLALYLCAQLAALLLVDNTGYLNRDVFVLSILSNGALALGLLAAFVLYRRRVRLRGEAAQVYWLAVGCTAALLAASLWQIHLVGSQSSLQHLLIVAVLLVVSWVLRWREVWLFFVAGNLGLAVVVYLETRGALAYAPLLAKGEALADVFLDWRTVLAQTVNYLLVLTSSTTLVWALRRRLERSEAQYAEAVARLQETLDQVETLKGLLPICASCKKMRDEEGHWRPLEVYLRRRAPELTFTHGICPECEERCYPG